MAELPGEILAARRALHGVVPSPGARERLYSSIVAPRRPVRHKLLGPALVTAAVLVASGAAAVGFGIVDLPLPFRAARTASEAAPSATLTAKRTVGRVGKNRSDPQPATPTALPYPPVPPTAALSEQQQATAQMPRTAPATGIAGASRHSSESPAQASELAQQVKAYRRAVTLISGQPARALDELRAFRRQWPGSALSHEVDLRIVQTLLTLGNRTEAQREAEVFLARHPRSGRDNEMRAIVEAAPRADAGPR